MKKAFLFIMTMLVISLFPSCKENNTPSGNDYVDLGLSSGTLCKSTNEVNRTHSFGLFTFDEAVAQFGQQLPSKEQWQELLDECTWSWTYEGFKVIGSNKKYIILPAEGTMDDNDKEPYGVGEDGNYWTSAPSGINSAWAFEFEKGGRDIGIDDNLSQNKERISVRLVK